jgi:transposase
MDIHRDFCEVAICEDGRVRSAGRIATSVAEPGLFAQSLASDDVVALEATSGAGLIVDPLERQVARVLVANTRKLPQISRAKAKTDRLDARTLATLAAIGMLETVWAPDEQIRALRRVCARRESLVRARTRARTRRMRCWRAICAGDRRSATASASPAACGRPRLSFPVDERLTLDGCPRRVDLLDEDWARWSGRWPSRRSAHPRSGG